MNNKMAKHTNLPIIETKKQTKQTRRTENHGYGKHFDDCQMGGVMEEWVKRRSTNTQLQKSHGNVKYSLGNGVAKELIRMIYGHE